MFEMQSRCAVSARYLHRSGCVPSAPQGRASAVTCRSTAEPGAAWRADVFGTREAEIGSDWQGQTYNQQLTSACCPQHHYSFNHGNPA